VLEEQRRSRVGLEVALALQPGRLLRLHEVHGHPDQPVRTDGVRHRHGVHAALGVHRAQDPVVVRGQAGERLLAGQPHRAAPAMA
jgi:hypothetical protein